MLHNHSYIMILMRLIVLIILATFLDIHIVKCYSSPSSSSGSSSSSSNSESDLSSRSSSGSKLRVQRSGSQDKDTTQPIQLQQSEQVSSSPIALTAAERKKIWDREYARKKRKANPNLSREQSRKYRALHENDPEWKARKKAYDKLYKDKTRDRKRLKDNEYRIRNREATARRQREARALKKKALLEGSTSAVLPTTRKRKNQEVLRESNQKRIRVGVSSHQSRINVVGTTPNSQGNRSHQPQGRNIVRLKLSQETIKKFYHNPPPSSPKQ